jgi:hypothetical protein
MVMTKRVRDELKARVRKDASRPLPARPVALLLGNDGRPTRNGLDYIQALARSGATQGFCASKLNLTAKQFKNLMADESDTATRLAFEAGHSELETEMSQILIDMARNGVVVAAIYFSKARLGWQEAAPPPMSNNVQIVLPAPLSAADYERRMHERQALEAQFTVVEQVRPPLALAAQPESLPPVLLDGEYLVENRAMAPLARQREVMR